jgi:hypothetical protein
MSQITILKVEKEVSPKGYTVTNVSYKNAEGKVKGMKVFPFKEQASVAAAFADASPGDVYEAAFRKNDKDFWEFAPTPTKTGATEKVTTGAASSAATPARGNWETSEERAARQVMIVRQSSISSAVNLVGAAKAKISTTEVIEMAKDFEAYVLGKDQPQKPKVTGDVE